MEVGLLKSLKGVFRVVPFVEDQGDVLALFRQQDIPLSKFLGNGLEDGGIRDVAFIDLMESGT